MSESTYPRPLSGIAHLSASSIGSFESCPRAWAAHYLFGVKGESGVYANIGKVMHKTIESSILGTGEKHDLSIVKAEEVKNLEKYVEKVSERKHRVFATEYEARVKWREGCPPILMFMDMVEQDDTGAIVITDHKSNRRFEGASEWQKKIQPRIYAWGARVLWGNRRVVFRIGYINLGETVEWETDPEEDANLVRYLDQVWMTMLAYCRWKPDEIPSIDWFPPVLNNYCNTCTICKSCPVYKDCVLEFENSLGLSTNNSIVHEDDSIVKQYLKFETIAKLATKICEESEAKLRELLAAEGKSELEIDGYVVRLKRGERRKIDFLTMWKTIGFMCEENQDYETMESFLEASSDIVTVGIGKLDEYLKSAPPEIASTLKKLVVKTPNEKETLKIDKV